MPENLYRKWRPRLFAEVAGQEHVTTTLLNALSTGRVAHAYLFAGPRGTGKTTTGRLLAKALNCRQREGGEPCNECESCRSYLTSRALDLIELDAASNRGIDEIRGLRDKVAFAAGAGDFKVYLIDEVHMLTDAAFNALLKTLEEPPPHVVFVLATTDAHKVPATIVSRCQRFDFRRISLVAAVRCLDTVCSAEGFAVDPAALELIARASTGSMRDAENLLEQIVTSYGPQLSVEQVRAGLGLVDDARAGELARLALSGDLGRGLTLIASVGDDGLDLRQFQREVINQLRALLAVKSSGAAGEGTTSESQREMVAAVEAVPVGRLLVALKAFGEADLKPDPNSTLPLDLALADCVLNAQPITAEAAPAPAAVPAPPPVVTRRTTLPAPPKAAAVANGGKPADSAGLPPVVKKADLPSADKAIPPDQRTAEPPAPKGGGADAEAIEPTRFVQAGDIAALRELLPRVYEEVRKREVYVGALLNSGCDIIEATETEITIAFRFENHAQKMAEPQNSRVVTEVFGQLIGKAVSLRCVKDTEVDSWTRRLPPRSPLVRAAQEMGARIISREEE